MTKQTTTAPRRPRFDPLSSKLHLDSLRIENYRCFRELTIERLARVNLIVGENGVGKTSVLEAIRIYARPSDHLTMHDLLEARDETTPLFDLRANPMKWTSVSFKSLFHSRKLLPDANVRIRIGSKVNRQKNILISLLLFNQVRELKPYHEDDPSNIFVPYLSYDDDFVWPMGIEPPKDFEDLFHYLNPREFHHLNSVFVSSKGLDAARVSKLCDETLMTSRDELLIASLRILDKKIERIGTRSLPGNDSVRVPFVKLSGSEEPLPLRSLGDGMNRLFAIALAMVNSKNGFLLLDEIENGVHYSIHAKLWKFIFQTAEALNVQVFATTHSWDCVKGFYAATRDHQGEGELIALRKKGDAIRAFVMNEREVGIATRDQIEIR